MTIFIIKMSQNIIIAIEYCSETTDDSYYAWFCPDADCRCFNELNTFDKKITENIKCNNCECVITVQNSPAELPTTFYQIFDDIDFSEYSHKIPKGHFSLGYYEFLVFKITMTCSDENF